MEEASLCSDCSRAVSAGLLPDLESPAVALEKVAPFASNLNRYWHDVSCKHITGSFHT